jgi:hypothetical protein
MRRKTAVLLFLTVHLLQLSAEERIIGIVSRVDGRLIHLHGNKREILRIADPITSGSEILESEPSGRERLEIITASGPVRFSRFPAKGFASYGQISEDLKDHYITALVGKTLRKGVSRGNRELLEWSMDLDVVDGEDIQAGFYLVLSKSESSKESRSFMPLSFKVREGLTIVAASYALVDEFFMSDEIQGLFERRGEDWIFRFDGLELMTDVSYRVKTMISLDDGKQIRWDFSFRVQGAERRDYVEKIIEESLEGVEGRFQRAMIRASVYHSFYLRLKALQILNDNGVDIVGLLD